MNDSEGTEIARLYKCDVFGEMAYWTKSPRMATLVAEEPTVYMKWDSDFWAVQARKCGVDQELNKIVRLRSNT